MLTITTQSPKEFGLSFNEILNKKGIWQQINGCDTIYFITGAREKAFIIDVEADIIFVATHSTWSKSRFRRYQGTITFAEDGAFGCSK